MSLSKDLGLSVVIPAFNEAGAVQSTLAAVQAALPKLGRPTEILVVDDGSTDQTAALAAEGSVRVVSHPLNSGYGRSLLTGIERARYDTIAILDADGTYPADRLPDLVFFYDKGFDMVVGARTGKHFEGSISKRLLRFIFRILAEYTCGRSIPDINSGFRVFDRRPVLARRASISTGFSFTTTITLLFMLTHRLVGYYSIPYHARVGSSKVRLFRDMFRSLQIILTAIASFNPLKLYLLLFFLHALGNAVLTAGLQASLSVVIAWNAGCVMAAVLILSLGQMNRQSD